MSTPALRISVITPRYAIGGVPLAQVRFARELSLRGHQVELVIGYIEPGCEVPPLEGVRLVHLDKQHVRGMLWALRSYLREVKPDVAFSAEDHLNHTLALAAWLAGSKVRLSGSSRVTPFETYKGGPFSKGWCLKWMARLVMWRSNVLTCVSRDMVLQYRQVFRNPKHVCVYNIVKDSLAESRRSETLTDPWFTESEVPIVVGCGQLVPWKGFPTLIAAVALLRRQRPVKLAILGEGPDRAQLEALIQAEGLQDSVRLLGYQPNPLKYFKRSQLFALSSTVEGLPNVLVEAMLCGCTPVSTNCPTGPEELLGGGNYGFLVPVGDSHAMAAALGQALQQPTPPEILAQATAPFEADRIIHQHLRLLGY